MSIGIVVEEEKEMSTEQQEHRFIHLCNDRNSR
jgi:hypothetical protein